MQFLSILNEDRGAFIRNVRTRITMTNLNAARLEARAHLPIVRKRIFTANKKTSQSSRSLFTTEELCELVAEMID